MTRKEYNQIINHMITSTHQLTNEFELHLTNSDWILKQVDEIGKYMKTMNTISEAERRKLFHRCMELAGRIQSSARDLEKWNTRRIKLGDELDALTKRRMIEGIDSQE